MLRSAVLDIISRLYQHPVAQSWFHSQQMCCPEVLSDDDVPQELVGRAIGTLQALRLSLNHPAGRRFGVVHASGF